QAGAFKPALDVVLDCLDVVHGGALNLGVLGNAVRTKVGRNGAQKSRLVGGQRACAGHSAGLTQVNEPLDLDVQARAVKSGLGQVVDERRGGGAVAAVERPQRNRGFEGGKGHKGGGVPGSHGAYSSTRTHGQVRALSTD